MAIIAFIPFPDGLTRPVFEDHGGGQYVALDGWRAWGWWTAPPDEPAVVGVQAFD